MLELRFGDSGLKVPSLIIEKIHFICKPRPHDPELTPPFVFV